MNSGRTKRRRVKESVDKIYHGKESDLSVDDVVCSYSLNTEQRQVTVSDTVFNCDNKIYHEKDSDLPIDGVVCSFPLNTEQS